MTELIVYDHPQAKSIETQLEMLATRFGDVLGSIMQPERLIRSIMIAMDRNRNLFKCERQSIVLSAMSAACVGLEVDSVLGQAFLVPFNVKGRGLVAQMMTGYKGYNTLAARGTYAIRSGVVRECEPFQFDKASAYIMHRPILGNARPIIGAWAKAASHSLPALIEVVGIDELLELRARAKSTQGENGAFSPWNDPKVGWPAMCEKTPKRRLARSMPLGSLPQYAMAARIDEAVEEAGVPAWATPDKGVVIDAAAIGQPPAASQAPIHVTTDREFPNLPPDLAAKATRLKYHIETIDDVKKLTELWATLPKTIAKIKVASPNDYDELCALYDKRIVVLSELRES